jgi:hypothetical protein
VHGRQPPAVLRHGNSSGRVGDEGRLNHVQIAADQNDGLVNHQSSVEAKIALFRSLFRGRDDV